jgi:non-heme Fe2+,alpha-ketoglutarate-dependent halogenase
MSPITLSQDELAHFEREGWAGPFSLLSPEEAQGLEPELRSCFARTRGYFYPPGVEEGDSFYSGAAWFQSLHTLSPRLAAVGRRPEVLDRVEQLLGPDLLQWGGIRFEQAPMERLHWHTDTEYDYLSGVSVWLGVQGTTPETALKIMPGSHRYETDPEKLQRDHGLGYDGVAQDADIVELLRHAVPDILPQIIRVPVRDGEFVLFNGKLWHASDNPSEQERVAMGLRYSAPDQRIRIPLTYLPPVIFDRVRAPCLLVRGEDRFGLNRLVDPPT